MNKRLAWLVPYPIKGSGGHRTFFSHIQYLCDQGYECDVYVHPEGECDVASVGALVRDYFRVTGANIKLGFQVEGDYDMIVATVWWSAKAVAELPINTHKAYFIQDYEAWFDAMGDGYILAEDSYRLGLIPITIGRWLSSRMANEFDTPSSYFPFTADQNIYRPLDDVPRQKAVCFLYQPEKPRRCPVIGREALAILKHHRPDVTIYTYGTDATPEFWFEHRHLGLLSWEDCNRLYNSCAVGLSLSASNPSRVPFEMLAAGLPVVDFHGDNTIYDMPDQAVLLAEKNPEALANALLAVLDSDDKQEAMRSAGLKHMRALPARREFEACREVIDQVIDGRSVGSMRWRPLYAHEPVRAVRPVLAAERAETDSPERHHAAFAVSGRRVTQVVAADRPVAALQALRLQRAQRRDLSYKLYRLGQSCAPIFAGFAAFIHAEAERLGHSDIFFFTREGKFFSDVYRVLQQTEQYVEDQRALHLLPVSRVATFMPSITEMSTDEMMRLWTLYSIQSMDALLTTLALDTNAFSPTLRRHGIDPDEVITYPWQDNRVQKLFADPDFTVPVHAERDRRRKLLDEFLRDHQFVDRGDRLIVDIGWRGSIQDNLARIYPDMRIDGLYLGLQRYLNEQPENTTKRSFLVDENQPNDPFGYLARHVKPLEMLCNTIGGSVSGYVPHDGTVQAAFSLDPEEDRVHTEFVVHFQAGVLAGMPAAFEWARRESVSPNEFARIARERMRDLIWSGDPVLAQAFFSLRHNETFGVGRSIEHARSMSLVDCLVALAVRGQRERALAPLRNSGWPHAVLRSRFLGIGHRVLKQKRLLHRL